MDSTEDEPTPPQVDAEAEPKVVSEVNSYFIEAKEISPSLRSNKIAKFLFSLPKPQCDGQATRIVEVDSSSKDLELQVDEDGDLILDRKGSGSSGSRSLIEQELFIEYENSTTLNLVGLQVWRGAFLLGDFIIHNASKYFTGKRVLELGSGTGITSIVAGLYAKHVTATDMNDQRILNLISINFNHNSKLIKSPYSIIALDFLDRNWPKSLEQEIVDAEVLFAADVIYHEKITEGFVQTLKQCLLSGKPKDVFIAVEKRYVFTLDDLDTVAPSYYYFLNQMESVLGVGVSGGLKSYESSTAKKLVEDDDDDHDSEEDEEFPFHLLDSGSISSDTSKRNIVLYSVKVDKLPQYFNYEKTKELVLFYIKSEES